MWPSWATFGALKCQLSGRSDDAVWLGHILGTYVAKMCPGLLCSAGRTASEKWAGALRLLGGGYFHSVSAWVSSSSAIGTQSPIIPVHKWTEQGPKLFASRRILNVLGMRGKLGVAFYISACPFFFYPWINSQCDLPITPLSIVVRPREKCGDGQAKNKRKNSSAHVDFPFHP